MKKLIVCCLTLALAISMAACGSDKAVSTSEAEEPATEEVEMAPEAETEADDTEDDAVVDGEEIEGEIVDGEETDGEEADNTDDASVEGEDQGEDADAALVEGGEDDASTEA